MRKLTDFNASEICILIIGLSYVIFASIYLIKLIKTKINGWIKDHIADDSKKEGVRKE